MEWIEVRAEFEDKEGILVAELVADAFLEAGITGVAIQDVRVQEEDDWAEGAGPEAGPNHVEGYFPDDGGFARRFSALEARVKQLEKAAGIRILLTQRRREEAEWAEAWKRHFHPLRIGKRLVVKPTWEAFEAKSDDVILEIDPGMAFGTGSHATTALCLELIEKYVSGKKAFLDIGCGSGILMIAAGKLGTCTLSGVDKDFTAVGVARENLLQNRIASSRFSLFAGSLAESVAGPFDLVAANILTEVILKLIPRVPEILSPGGVFLCSGMIEKNTHRVEERMARCGLRILEKPSKEGWVAIAALR